MISADAATELVDAYEVAMSLGSSVAACRVRSHLRDALISIMSDPVPYVPDDAGIESGIADGEQEDAWER